MIIKSALEGIRYLNGDRLETLSLLGKKIQDSKVNSHLDAHSELFEHDRAPPQDFLSLMQASWRIEYLKKRLNESKIKNHLNLHNTHFLHDGKFKDTLKVIFQTLNFT